MDPDAVRTFELLDKDCQTTITAHASHQLAMRKLMVASRTSYRHAALASHTLLHAVPAQAWLFVFHVQKNKAGLPRDWKLIESMLQDLVVEPFVVQGSCPAEQDVPAVLAFLTLKQRFDLAMLIPDGRMLFFDFIQVERSRTG